MRFRRRGYRTRSIFRSRFRGRRSFGRRRIVRRGRSRARPLGYRM